MTLHAPTPADAAILEADAPALDDAAGAPVPRAATSASDAAAVAAADAAMRLIPPLWPLAATVAVNPFLGYADTGLAQTAAQVARAHGVRPFAPRAHRLAQIAAGEIAPADLAAGLAAAAAGLEGTKAAGLAGATAGLCGTDAAAAATAGPRGTDAAAPAGPLGTDAAALATAAAGPLGTDAAALAAGPVGPRGAEAAALAGTAAALRAMDAAALAAAAGAADPAAVPAPTVAALAAARDGVDWPALIEDRLGAWAAAWADRGQALWVAPRAGSAWASWRAWAARDLTPEIVGLRGFCAHVGATPDAAGAALAGGLDRLGVPAEAWPAYLHRLGAELGGWGQHARGLQWRAERDGGTDAAPVDLLAARLTWEVALLERGGPALAADWAAAAAGLAAPARPSADDLIDAALQEAAEHAARRRLAALLAAPAPAAAEDRPSLQAAFCIDVRSEPFRRALESLSPGVRTLGFAGFFGLGVAHRACGSDVGEDRLPVLLAPRLTATTATPDAEEGRVRARALRAWGRFRQAAVSSLAYVEAAGPLHGLKLAADALGLGRAAPAPAPAPRLDPPPPLAARADAAAGVLRAMSMTGNLAPLVLLIGHGARVANNPHASAYACGACGGHSGEVNARLLAALLNDPEVRAALPERGVVLPADTRFVAGLHDTVADTVTLFEDAPGDATGLAAAARLLEQAGRLTRAERALRLPGAHDGEALPARGRDWAQVRPEWGLAGCMAFIAAPRARTTGRDLGGRAFLHDYDWRADAGFGVLELILTAPVVVASWISLQYYGSATAPGAFGAGDKLLHNVVGGLGVLEGAGGVLRGGLPWQAVHDGERLVHDPLRLAVLVEAPRAALAATLDRHPGVAALFDNGWLSLGALDEAGRIAWRAPRGAGWTEAEAA